MSNALIVAETIRLILLHGGENNPIHVNPTEVVTVRPVREGEHFAKTIHCVVTTADGKYVAVIETCDDVYEKLSKFAP